MNIIEDIGPDMSGIDQLRAMVAQGRNPGIADTMRFRITEIEEGRVVCESEPGLHVYNPIGSVHGGYAATLLDTVCGCAVQSRLAPGQRYTTLELKVAYHRSMTVETGTVRATGTVVSIGRRAAFAEARLEDAGGRLLASATSSLLVMGS